MATWPASLPQSLLAAGLTRKRQPGKLRSQADTGPAKQRPRFTAVVKQFPSASIHVTGAELATFDAFYEDDLGHGSLSFDWKDPITDVAASLRFTDEPEPTLIRAHDDPDLRLYHLTLPLEILP